jgi:hypothetical protein
MANKPLSDRHRAWATGQQLLAEGHYVAAATFLSEALANARRQEQWLEIAQISLPLLEARRQIRQQAVAGVIAIAPTPAKLNELPPNGATVILAGTHAVNQAQRLRLNARAKAMPWEVLVLVAGEVGVRLCSPAAPQAAVGLTKAEMKTLPGAGWWEPGTPMHVLAREAILHAWEELTLRWQEIHMPKTMVPKAEMVALETAWQVDEANERVAMRYMALAEGIGKRSK